MSITKCWRTDVQSRWWPGFNKHLEKLVTIYTRCCRKWIQTLNLYYQQHCQTYIPWQKLLMICLYRKLLVIDDFSRYIEIRVAKLNLESTGVQHEVHLTVLLKASITLAHSLYSMKRHCSIEFCRSST